MIQGLKLLMYGIFVIALLCLLVIFIGLFIQTKDYNYIGYIVMTIFTIYISNKLAVRFINNEANK